MLKQNAIYLTLGCTTFIPLLTDFNFYLFTPVLDCKKYGKSLRLLRMLGF